MNDFTIGRQQAHHEAMHGELIEARLTQSVIGAFYDAYNALRYGFREHVYSLALERELLARGHRVSRELAVPIFYKGEELTSERLDFVVDERLVVELKSTAMLPPGAERQLLSYLTASRLEVGLLLHYGPQARFYRMAVANATEIPSPSGALRGRIGSYGFGKSY